jgi:hypothetical protein
MEQNKTESRIDSYLAREYNRVLLEVAQEFPNLFKDFLFQEEPLPTRARM